MQIGVEHFAWSHMARRGRKFTGLQVAGIVVIGVFAAWLFLGGGLGFLLSLIGTGGDIFGEQVYLEVQTNDGIMETVFTPAGASVKVWDKASGLFLGALTEDTSHDGKWDGAFTVRVGSIVCLKVADSGATYYTNIVERLVPAAKSGVDRIGVLEPIDVFPCSATTKSDVVFSMMTSGALVTNSTNIASGTTSIQFLISVTSGKQWGGHSYYDIEAGEQYAGAFVTFDLTTTTARATISGGNLYAHFAVGSHEYWIFTVPPTVNDDDVTTDGTYSFTISFSNLVAAADALDIGCFTNAHVADVMAANFGTITANGIGDQADNMTDIHLA